MSEKALRKLIEPLAERHVVTGDVRKFRGRLKTALDDDPDVVKLCRELLAEAETERREKRHNYIIIMATLEKVALRLQVKFHFRLTDDGGYEWMEEEK